MIILDNITNDFLKAYYGYNPVAATADGYSGFDDRWPDLSRESVQQYTDHLRQIVGQASQLQTDQLDDAVDVELVSRKAEVEIFECETLRSHVLNPAFYVNSVSTGLFLILTDETRSAQERIHFAVSRLKALPGFFKQAGTNLVNPVKLWRDIALDESQGLVSYLQQVVLDFLKEHQVLGAQKLIEDARYALFKFTEQLRYLKHLTSDFSIGEDNFEYLLTVFHGLNLSAREVREIGLSKIDELSELLSKQAQLINPEKSWQDLIEQFKAQHPKEENLLNEYKRAVQNIKSFLLKKDLVTLPLRENLEVISTPEFYQSSIPYAAYFAPTMFSENSKGHFFVTPTKGREDVLREHCFAALPITALHEAYPGHHLQFARQKEISSAIRKVFNVASFYEGWTLYCEELMFEQGFYDDATRLYQLKDLLWRAVRIVVDVSMHCFGMSHLEAVKFLVEQAKLSVESARIDVNWYSQSPTVPMSYLMGMLEVKNIKNDYLKTGKSPKQFHDAFLTCGAIPLSCVRRLLNL